MQPLFSHQQWKDTFFDCKESYSTAKYFMIFNEKKIFLRIQARDEEALKTLMHHYRAPFTAWARGRFSMLADIDYEDAYAHALVKFYNKATNHAFVFPGTRGHSKDKHLADLELEKLEQHIDTDDRGELRYIKAYLYTTAKNYLINKLAKKNTAAKHEQKLGIHIEQLSFSDIQTELEREDLMKLVQEGMDQLSESQRKVLILKFYYGYDMESIAREMSYDNPNVAKTVKYQAITRLRSIMAKIFKREQIT